MITTAGTQHWGQIHALWQQAFGDSNDYTRLFLSRRAQPENTLVFLQNGMVAGMLFLLPCQLVYGNRSYRCAYIYGVATLLQRRGQGISTQLLQHAHRLCGERGYDVCTLAPATPALFAFYAQRGYRTQGFVKTLTVTVQELSEDSGLVAFPQQVLEPAEILRLRRVNFGNAYLEWDRAAIEYAMAENALLGGSFHCYSCNGRRGFAYCAPLDSTLLVRELTGDDALLPALLRGLHTLYNKESYQLSLCNTAAAGELTPIAMTHWLHTGTDEPFYPSLLLN